MMLFGYFPLFLLNNSGFLRISRPLKAENLYLLLKWGEDYCTIHRTFLTSFFLSDIKNGFEKKVYCNMCAVI